MGTCPLYTDIHQSPRRNPIMLEGLLRTTLSFRFGRSFKPISGPLTDAPRKHSPVGFKPWLPSEKYMHIVSVELELLRALSKDPLSWYWMLPMRPL